LFFALLTNVGSVDVLDTLTLVLEGKILPAVVLALIFRGGTEHHLCAVDFDLANTKSLSVPLSLE